MRSLAPIPSVEDRILSVRLRITLIVAAANCIARERSVLGPKELAEAIEWAGNEIVDEIRCLDGLPVEVRRIEVPGVRGVR